MGDSYKPHHGRHEPRGSRDRYRPNSHYDGQGTEADRYTFRGASRYDERRHNDAEPRRNERDRYVPQEQFSFRPPDSYNVQFPSPQNRDSTTRRAPYNAQQHDTDTKTNSRRGNGGRGGRGHTRRGGFKPRAANAREILSKSMRETTPEQLQGMNDGGQSKFNLNVENDSDDSDEEEEGDDSEDNPRKKRKLGQAGSDLVPQWSNPDPYTALPPPETLGAPKKDIVQVIRKAKADVASKVDTENAVAANEDFISFGDDDAVTQTDASDHDEKHAYESSPAPSASYRRSPDAIPSTRKLSHEEQALELLLNEAKGMKRKRGGANKISGDVLEAWHAVSSNSAPWCSVTTRSALDPGLRLHLEICDFFEFVKPEPFEESVRHDLVAAVERAIRTSYLPHARNVDVKCFGSFAAGLYLPTADMDLVAVTPDFMKHDSPLFCQTRSSFYKLGNALRHMARPGDFTIIAKARVPIVKFTDLRSGIKVDISVENRTGTDAIRTFDDWKTKYPAMPVLVVLVKQLVAMRGLNEVFTGGVGGFTIICLVTSMLQLMPELQAQGPAAEPRYGELLLRFLDLYGNKFNIRTTGISMNPPGYFDKQLFPLPKQNMERLTIQDPNNSENDISGGSHLIETVFAVFREAHASLQRQLNAVHTGRGTQKSILSVILGGNYDPFTRQRDKLRDVHDASRRPNREHSSNFVAHNSNGNHDGDRGRRATHREQQDNYDPSRSRYPTGPTRHGRGDYVPSHRVRREHFSGGWR